MIVVRFGGSAERVSRGRRIAVLLWAWPVFDHADLSGSDEQANFCCGMPATIVVQVVDLFKEILSFCSRG